jgi:Uma2 family endonuclease
MGIPLKKESIITSEEYLAIERKAGHKSEFYDGGMFAMAGASARHNLIVSNLVVEIGNQIKSKDCRIYSSDMRLNIHKNGLYTYPDIMVTCGNELFSDDVYMDTLLNPILIIEVLSKSTESYDRGKKFKMYRELDSLMEYVLVAQDNYHVEHYLRQNNDKWILSDCKKKSSWILLLNYKINMIDIYNNIKI